MATRLIKILLRICLLVAIVASTALYVDYQSASGGGFCADATSGCGHVRSSPYSHIAGIGLPTIGMIGFVLLFALSLWATQRRHFETLAGACVAAGLGAATLIYLQIFEVKAICAWCMAIDVSAIAAAGLALVLYRMSPEPEPRGLRMLWAGVGVVCVAVPLTWETAPPVAEVPPAVDHYYAPGRVDVVMFTDFECPYCRALHTVIEEIVADNPEIHLERVMVPLRGHVGAEPSALGYLCAPDDKREALADVLYGREPGPLTLEQVVDLAEPLGIERKAFAACLKSDETKKQLEAEKDLFRQAQLKGLPSTFVEQELVVGADEQTLRAAIDRALEGHSAEGGIDVGYMFALLAIVVGAVAAASLRSARDA